MRPTKLISRRAKEAAEADEAMRQRPMMPMRLMSRRTNEADELTRLMMARSLGLMRLIWLARPRMPLKPIEPSRLMWLT
jgi:hypothetical protein